MSFIKKNYINLLILLILAVGAWLRANSYGDLRLSIATADTADYVNSSKAPLFSWKIIAGQRLLTTNLIYKVVNDTENCPITSYGKPAIGEEDFRRIQPCFDKIALLQNFLAIFGWCFLAWTTAKFLQSPVIKIVSVTAIILFGFTPQIAEWDSILSPESLSLSMLAITLALAQELVFRVSNSVTPFDSRLGKGLLAGWVGLFLTWIFIRDIHLYTIPATLVLLAPLFFIKKFQKTKHLLISFVILSIFFIVGFISAKDSLRAITPLTHSIDAYIWPHPTRVEYFRKFGMPERTASTYREWANEDATKAYGLFLISHPGFVASTLWNNLDHLNSNSIQPYFFTPEVKHRDILLTFGEMLHPQTSALYLVSVILLLALITHAIQLLNPVTSAWAWLGTWFFAIAAITLFLGYFGDSIGIRRHIMPSVEMFRLFIWVFLMPFLDQSVTRTEQR